MPAEPYRVVRLADRDRVCSISHGESRGRRGRLHRTGPGGTIQGLADRPRDAGAANEGRDRGRHDDRCDLAGPLAVYGIAGEALALLRGASIIGALESRMRRVPFRTKVPRETGSGTRRRLDRGRAGDAGGGDRV